MNPKDTKLKHLEPEDAAAAKRIKEIQAYQRARNPLRRKQNTDSDDIGMVSSFLETKLLKSELLLHEAARRNNVDVVRRLCAINMNLDCRNHVDRTPLQWAASTGGMEIIKLLLEHGADVEASDKYGMSPVLWASWFGHVKAMEFILACGADAYSTNKQGFNILHCAASQNHLDVVKYILAKLDSYDISLADNKGHTALHLAGQEGHIEVFGLLVERTKDLERKDKHGRTALLLACSQGETEIVENALEAKADIDARDTDGMTALHLAAENGHSDVADVILRYRPPEPIEEVIEAVPDICEAVADADKEADEAKEKQKSGGAFSKWFRKSRENVVDEDAPKLEEAVEDVVSSPDDLTREENRKSLADIVTQLIIDAAEKQAIEESRPQPKIFSLKDEPFDDERRMTAMHMAAGLGHIQFVRVLLQHGCNPNVINKHGNSPLHLASLHQHRSIIADLSENAGDINQPNDRLCTPLHLAVEKGNVDSVEELLIHGADTTLLDKSGKTPLQVAARGSFLEIVDMIIKADVNTDKIRRFAFSSNSPQTKRKIDKEYQHFLNQDTKAIITHRGPNVYRTIQHPHAEIMKPILFKLAHHKMHQNDWKHLAKFWHFQDQHVTAIQHQYTGDNSYKHHGYRLLMIWLHGEDPKSNPMKTLHEALVKVGRKSMAESLRRGLQSECTGGAKQTSCITN